MAGRASRRILKNLHNLNKTNGETISEDHEKKGNESQFRFMQSLLLKSEDNDKETGFEKEFEAQVYSPAKKHGTKKKNKNNNKKDRKLHNKLEDELDEELDKLNLNGGNKPIENLVHVDNKLDLFKIDSKKLDFNNEILKFFGKTVASKKRNYAFSIRNRIISQPKDDWPITNKHGIIMNLLKTDNNMNYYCFKHSKNYQEIQSEFSNVSIVHDHEHYSKILSIHPYHVDSLLQYSEICRINGENQLASDLIERAIYVHEMAFEPSFSYHRDDCKLDYKIRENRCFYIALFRFISVCSTKGLNNTALEITKIFLKLCQKTFDQDPLALVLSLDFLCLRSKQFNYLIKYFEQYDNQRNLIYLPNITLSLCLISFITSSSITKIDIQTTILRFPGLFVQLLNHLNVFLHDSIRYHVIFNSWADSSESPSLKCVYNLYVKNCSVFWNDKKVIDWVVLNMKEVCEKFDSLKNDMQQYHKIRLAKYRSLPEQIKRYLVLSPHLNINLPRQQIDDGDIVIFDNDPFPPADSIDFYIKIKTNPLNIQSSSVDGFFSSLMSSLLPGYNANSSEYSAIMNEVFRNIRQSISSVNNNVTNTVNGPILDENQAD